MTEYYRIGMYSTNVTTQDCGPFNYTIDPVCSKFISVAEDLSTNELVFTYNQPKDVEWRVGIVQECSLMVGLEYYPEVRPNNDSYWKVNITESGSVCPDTAEYFMPATTANAITYNLITDNVAGNTYTIPFPDFLWSPTPCFRIAGIDFIDTNTNAKLAAEYINLIKIGDGEFTVTVPYGLTDDTSLNMMIVYRLNDTAGTEYVQDFIVEFMAVDYCQNAQIWGP